MVVQFSSLHFINLLVQLIGQVRRLSSSADLLLLPFLHINSIFLRDRGRRVELLFNLHVLVLKKIVRSVKIAGKLSYRKQFLVVNSLLLRRVYRFIFLLCQRRWLQVLHGWGVLLLFHT